MTAPRPQLYWISGSPPAWRVMLALTLKSIAFESRQLDHGEGENRAPEYVKLNPKGQVPTLVAGDLVIRESIAILGWIDRVYAERPIWGERAQAAAQVWQDVMEMEAGLRAPVTATAQALLRGSAHDPATLASLADACDGYAARLAHQPFLGGDSAMASDIWLYPALHWIARGTALAGPKAPEICTSLTSSRPALAAWMHRFRAGPGVAGTYPPHWRT